MSNLILIFFFSSRRRHTRCLSDWSSDVCSSDLDLGPEGGDGGGEIVTAGTPEDVVKVERGYTGKFLAPVLRRREAKGKRSEERWVGKECRFRWGPYH